MWKHRGEIVEAVVRKSGYSIKVLADKLEVSRNTIYNKFREYNLSYDFIVKLGNILPYDFTVDFPEIKTAVPINDDQHTAELWRLQHKYTQLLDRYHKLSGFLVKLVQDQGLHKLQEELAQFTEPLPEEPPS